MGEHTRQQFNRTFNSADTAPAGLPLDALLQNLGLGDGLELIWPTHGATALSAMNPGMADLHPLLS